MKRISSYESLVNEALNVSNCYDDINWDILKRDHDLTTAQTNTLKSLYRKALKNGGKLKSYRSNARYDSSYSQNDRPVTQTTRMCICRWHYEGDSIKLICELLHREESVVINILRKSFRNGFYKSINIGYRAECEEDISINCDKLARIATELIADRHKMEERYAARIL